MRGHVDVGARQARCGIGSGSAPFTGTYRPSGRLFDFWLDAEAIASLDAATSALRPIPGDCGDEYRRAPFLTAAGDLVV